MLYVVQALVSAFLFALFAMLLIFPDATATTTLVAAGVFAILAVPALVILFAWIGPRLHWKPDQDQP